MNEQPKYYAVKDVYALIFSGSISLTTMHKLVRCGEIPSTQFLKKRLIPSWWVDKELSKLAGAQNETK